MCGTGERFKAAGYTEPKPWIDVKGRTMIDRVVENLKQIVAADRMRFIFVTRDGLHGPLNLREDQYRVVKTDRPTRGAVDSLLAARTWITNEQPLVVANCDQIVNLEPHEWVIPIGKDASVLTFFAPDHSTAWSYVETDEQNNITRIAEKQPISSDAVVGIYYFRQGWQFSSAVADVLDRRAPSPNGEFYTSAVIQEMANGGYQIDACPVERARVHMIGTPELVKEYEQCL